MDDHVSVKKHVWGVRPTTASSSWGQRNMEAAKNTHSRKTQSVTTLSGLNVQCKSAKKRVSSGTSAFEGHNTLQNNLVEDTSLKSSKLNENNTIKWCLKDAVHTQTLERLNVSP